MAAPRTIVLVLVAAAIAVAASAEDVVVVAPFHLELRDMGWNGDPHAMPSGRAVLDTGGRTIWELAGVSRAVASADGGTVALLTRDLHVLVATLPEVPRQLDEHFYLTPRLSSDGALLVAQRLGDTGHVLEKTVGTQGIALLDLASRQSRLILEGNDVYSPSFGSDSIVFFGSGGTERTAALYLMDLQTMRVARAANRAEGACRSFPSSVPESHDGRILYVADGKACDLPAPLPGDFEPLHRFDAQPAVSAGSGAHPGLGPVRLRRPSVQVKQPKVYEYYDQDRVVGKIRDWRCLQTTYDQHQGTDFNQSYGYDVVAPASGVVILRYDGCPDFESPGCGFGYGNHVVIQHSDGTASALGHGKKGTPVGFGSYACGAFLMKSASSGSSHAYHIHHALWANADDGYQSPKSDPFEGICDPNDPSNWSTQNPYGDIPGTACVK